MIDILQNEMNLWLLATAVVFTAFGYLAQNKNKNSFIVDAMIDQLIREGYIKTKGKGEDEQSLKHWEKQTVIKNFIIETADIEFYIKAMDLQDALETWNGAAKDIICIKEFH